MSTTTPSEQTLAKLACVSCHAQKRKCSRQLPQCDLCLKKRKRCEYPLEAFDDSTPGSADAPLDNRFPALFFLDTWLFRNRRLSVGAMQARLPGGALVTAVGSPENLRAVWDHYFSIVHPSFPVLSKIKAYGQLLTRPLGRSDEGPDIVFLLLAVRLVCATDQAEVLYRLAKQCYAALETQGVVTSTVLQGVLLLTYWEVGQGVYPAAFLSVGLCARIGQALGLHQQRGAAPMYPTASAVGAEEYRRMWWGILILDRYVTAGLVGRPFACEDAQPQDLLPMLETSWDLGEPCVTPSLAACADVSRPVSAFARLCQASHLLSRVLRHTNEKPTDWQLWYQDGIRLHHVLEALVSGLGAAPTGASPAYPAMGLLYSSQVLLYDSHTCADFDDAGGVGSQDQLEMQSIAMAGIKTVCRVVSRFAVEVRLALSADEAMASSPLVMNCMYEAAKYYFWYYREAGRPELLSEVNEIMLTLQGLRPTWALAAEYLSILGGDEFRPGQDLGD
ncbi:hypothetical protein B0T25DRAFT_560340 [Lasiosphaeria hispida]|uniref:Zn(2)-C6 fungal-type domain-containing protein n=1 Tax=Lasiosphaeria hispida TaxID=260671 RepID=A0AAJ0M7N1_9PEZI|nr:hypothetical protein B0T25DRAFT_560340 [Lasiosphaeria hispida]